MIKLILALLAIAPLSPARDRESYDWNNLRGVNAARPVEVVKRSGESLKGDFVRFTTESLTIKTRNGDVVVSKSEIQRVRLRGHRARNTWIGAGLGAAAGAGLGAGIGEGLSNTSGGDFANLKPAVVGACAVVGAGLGAVFGSVFSGRHADIYRAN